MISTKLIGLGLISILGINLILAKRSAKNWIDIPLIEMDNIRKCQSKSICNDCWSVIEEQLSINSPKECRMPMPRSIMFDDSQNYCCQLWRTFDCQSNIAARLCAGFSYVEFRLFLINWSNNLMQRDVCSDFDYNSEKCKSTTQSADHLTLDGSSSFEFRPEQINFL